MVVLAGKSKVLSTAATLRMFGAWALLHTKNEERKGQLVLDFEKGGGFEPCQSFVVGVPCAMTWRVNRCQMVSL